MKIISIILLFILLYYNSPAQVIKHFVLPSTVNDTSDWLRNKRNGENLLGLTHLTYDTSGYFIRYFQHGQFVDLWTYDHKNFFGKLTNYAETYEELNMKKQEAKESKLYSNSVELDTGLARNVYEKIYSIKRIPTRDKILGWHIGCDGVSYQFEFSTPQTYYYKDYWSPKSQDSSLIEPKLIQNCVDYIDSVFDLQRHYNSFFETLKPGPYIGESFWVVIKPTEKQRNHMNKMKPYHDYLNSIKDTLNNYINDTLPKILKENNYSISYFTFFLKFNSKNKLKKVKTYGGFSGFSDRFDFYKSRKKIKKAFKKFEINFVHSEIPYYLTLHNLNDTIFVQ